MKSHDNEEHHEYEFDDDFLIKAQVLLPQSWINPRQSNQLEQSKSLQSLEDIGILIKHQLKERDKWETGNEVKEE